MVLMSCHDHLENTTFRAGVWQAPKTPKADPKLIESRQFKNFDSDAFIEDIKETPFHLASLLDDPNEMWEVWKSLFLEIANKHAPIRKRKVKSKSSPWISSELRQKMRKRDFLKKQAVKQNSHQMWNDYKKARNDVNASVREARTNFFNESIKKHSGNLKETWKVINSSLGRNCKVTVINELVYEGKDFTEKQDIAEQKNNHFCSLGSKLASGIPDTAFQPEDFLNRTDSNFYFRPVREGYIHNLITKLKPSVKAGFHMIADDRRRSRIADRRRSQRELFPYNRRRSQTIAEPAAAIHFGQQKCQMYKRVVLAAKS